MAETAEDVAPESERGGISLKVAICGPPHSGKSTFTTLLENAVEERLPEQYHPQVEFINLDVQDRSSEELREGEDVGEEQQWSNEIAQEVRAEFDTTGSPLVVADAPGKVTEQTEIVLDPADAIILLARSDADERTIEAWLELADTLNLEILAHIQTSLDDPEACYWDPVERKGRVANLRRSAFDDGGPFAFPSITHGVVSEVAGELLGEVF